MPLIAGNWKMNTSVSEAVRLIQTILAELDPISGVEKVVCPPFVSLVPIRELIKGSSIQLGAQNMYFEEKGAFTGEISPAMLADLCRYVIIGHSERRHYFGETDEFINRKIRAAFKFGVIPILCVGERLEENEVGRTQEVVNKQVTSALRGLNASSLLVIAYEPVWAIGTGKAATVEQARATIKFIRETVAVLWGKDTAQEVRILYGGSVTRENISEFVVEVDIDGALVGSASLKADEFLAIVKQTALTKGKAKL